MKMLILLIILLGVSFPSGEKKPKGCFSYESAKVTLKGKISRKTFAGRPNYESIEKGDEPETYWILHLSEPICVKGDESMPNGESTENNVFDIQLGLDEEQYAKYKDLLGKPVVIRGTLSHAISGHHHTNILLKVIRLGADGSN